MTAGALTERVQFSSPVPNADGENAGWSVEMTLWAGFTYLRAGETVMQGRMEGRNTIVVRIRRSSDSLRIKEDWKAVNQRTGQIMAVRSIVPTLDRAYLDITCETGVQP